MEIGYEIWDVEVIKHVIVWNMDNIEKNMKRIWWRRFDILKTWTVGGLLKWCWWVYGCYTMWEIFGMCGKLLAFKEAMFHGICFMII